MPWTTIIQCHDLAVHVQNPGWVVCDCRFSLADPNAGAKAYADGHIPNAQYVHLERDLSAPQGPFTGRHPLPEPADLARRFSDWGIDDQVQVVAYDDSGGTIAARLWWLLRWLGHDAVAVLDGGWQRWLALRNDVDTRMPAPTARRFVAKPDDHAWLDTNTVGRLLDNDAITLIDARSGERFRGEQESIDPVAGHVPGALNRPCLENLDASGCMRPEAQLRDEFAALLPPSHAPVVHMCGSGVTACHNQLAMEIAGLPPSRLYVGSWSEWIRDPARRVATGAD